MKYGNSRFESLTPVLTATPDYSIGDVIGAAPMQINLNGGMNGGVIQNVTVTDKANQKPQMTLLFFAALPTGTYTDNAAIVMSDADKASLLGKIEVVTADWSTIGAEAVATVYGPLVIRGAKASGTVANKFTLYCVPVNQGAVYNAGTVSDLNFNFGELLD